MGMDQEKAAGLGEVKVDGFPSVDQAVRSQGSQIATVMHWGLHGVCWLVPKGLT